MASQVNPGLLVAAQLADVVSDLYELASSPYEPQPVRLFATALISESTAWLLFGVANGVISDKTAHPLLEEITEFFSTAEWWTENGDLHTGCVERSGWTARDVARDFETAIEYASPNYVVAQALEVNSLNSRLMRREDDVFLLANVVWSDDEVWNEFIDQESSRIARAFSLLSVRDLAGLALLEQSHIAGGYYDLARLVRETTVEFSYWTRELAEAPNLKHLKLEAQAKIAFHC